MKEKDCGLVSLEPAEQSKQTDKCSSEHLCLLAMANSKLLEFYCLGFSQGTSSARLAEGTVYSLVVRCGTSDHKDSYL